MPWSVGDVSKHNSHVSEEDKPEWVDIANGTRDSCIKRGGSETMCDALAIATANKHFKEAAMKFEEAEWTGAFINDLPDSSFLYIESGGEKDEDGKTAPRGLRHFPVKGADGTVDLPHLRNALARIPQSAVSQAVKDKAIAQAQTLAKKHLPSYQETGEVLYGDFVPLEEKAVTGDGTALIKIIGPGWGASGYYSADVLARDANAYKSGTKMYWDHPTVTEARERPERSLRDLAGELVEDGKFLQGGPIGPGVYAKAKVFEAYKPAIEELAQHIGVSHRAIGSKKIGEAEGKKGPIIEKIAAAQSVDYVTAPGAKGEVVQLFEAARPATDVIITGQENGYATFEPSVNYFQTQPWPVESTWTTWSSTDYEWGSVTLDGLKKNRPDIIEALRSELKEAIYGEKEKLKEGKRMDEEKVKELEDKLAEVETAKADLEGQLARMKEVELLRQATDFVAERVANADIPNVTKERLIETLGKNPIKDEEGKLDAEKYSQHITEAIKSEAEYIATITESGKIRGMGPGSAGSDGNAAFKESMKRGFLSEGMGEEQAEKLAQIAARGR